MNKTRIPWCDYTWNPVVGCSRASAGCDNCYAESISKRFHFPWGRAHLCSARLSEPSRLRRPSLVFTVSMGDLGHHTVKPTWIRRVAESMADAPQHTYIVLTKRPGPWVHDLPESCWVGVSIENQENVWRWAKLLAIAPRALRFASVEPMLGPVTFRGFTACAQPAWVIAGPENARRPRPFNPEWLAALSRESYCFFDKSPDWIRREHPLVTQ